MLECKPSECKAGSRDTCCVVGWTAMENAFLTVGGGGRHSSSPAWMALSRWGVAGPEKTGDFQLKREGRRWACARVPQSLPCHPVPFPDISDFQHGQPSLASLYSAWEKLLLFWPGLFCTVISLLDSSCGLPPARARNEW